MPSDVTTPALFAYTAGGARDTRPAPVRLVYSASTTLVLTKDSDVSVAVDALDLDRLLPLDRLLNEDGTPSLRFMAIWQTMCDQIESAIAATNAKVDDNTAILARLTAAEALAEAANDNAAAATATATAVQTATAQTFADIDPVYQDSFNERVDIP